MKKLSCIYLVLILVTLAGCSGNKVGNNYSAVPVNTESTAKTSPKTNSESNPDRNTMVDKEQSNNSTIDVGGFKAAKKLVEQDFKESELAGYSLLDETNDEDKNIYSEIFEGFSKEDKKNVYMVAIRKNTDTVIGAWYFVDLKNQNIFCVGGGDLIPDKDTKWRNPHYYVSDNNKKSSDKGVSQSDIIGLWQFDTPSVAAGYGDRYYFFKDNTFKYERSQMNSDNRNLGFSGTWNIINNKIHLDIRKEQTLVGGKIEESPSSITGYEIVGARIQDKDVNKDKEFTYGVETEGDFIGVKIIQDNSSKFYYVVTD